MAVIQTGTSTSGVANVDASFNVQVTTPGVNSTGVAFGGGSANGQAMFSENDAGSVTLARSVSSPKTSQDRRIRVGQDTILFNDTFNALTQNTNNWNYIFATLTASQPGAGTLNFGTVQGTAVTHGAIMKTFQHFPLVGTAPLILDIDFGQFNSALIANEEWRCGLGNPATAGTAPTDGVWLKLTTSGLFLEEVYNGSTTSSASLATLASFTVGTQFEMQLIVGERLLSLWRNDILLGSLTRAAADGQPFIQASLPLFMQKLCTGTVSNTNTMRVGDITVAISDIDASKPYFHQLAGMGQAGNIGQNGNTQGKTSLWANNTAPTAVALTNTTAAFTGLGGIVAVLPTLAANSDGKLITFQNPAPTINITGRNLYVTGVKIQGAVSVIFVGGPVTYAYALAYGHTATSLATAETASFATQTTHSPRIMPLGIETYAVTAAVGTAGAGVYVTFDTPIVVRPGEFVDVIARNIGVVTTTGAVTSIVAVDSYWE